MKSTRSIVLLGGVCSAAAISLAAEPPDAVPPRATPEITYHSAFADYRPFKEEPVADWRALNDDVAKAGGHVGIMRGASAAAGAHRSNNQADKPVRAAPRDP